MRNSILFTLLFLLTANSLVAQNARVKKYKAPKAGTVVLKDVDDKYNAHVYSKEMPDPDAKAEQKKLQDVKKQVGASYPRHKTNLQKKTSVMVQQPILGLNFIADSVPGIPPDNYMAVSKGNKGVTVMNSTISVHDVTTGNMIYRKDLFSFSRAVGLNNTVTSNNNYRYDPKVVYDPVADRFICIILNGINQFNWVVLGFSNTNDPAGTWNFYKFYGDYTGDTTWFDYPAISITQNEVFFTGNKIKYDSSWQAGFTQTLIYQVNKWDGYNGDSLLNYQIWDSIMNNNQPLRCLYPLNPGDAQLGPSQYFLSNRNFDVTNDSIFIVEVPDTIGAPDSTLTVTAVASSSATYGVPPDALQPDTSVTLATNDGRILGGFIEGNEIQFVSTAVDPSSGSSAIYHGVISNFNSSPTLSGSIFGIDTLDFGYPNISYSGNFMGNNQAIISFDFSGPNTYPGYGAVMCDNGNFSGMLVIKQGVANINMLNQKEQRWGDYSGSQPDWDTLGEVWCEGIFGHKSDVYGNYMAHLISPYQLAVPNVSKPAAEPSKVYPNPAWLFVNFEFTVTAEQVFSFTIYDMQGRVVDKLLDQNCPEGNNVLQFNTAPLAPGNYIIKATGSKGESINVNTFVRK